MKYQIALLLAAIFCIGGITNAAEIVIVGGGHRHHHHHHFYHPRR